MFELVYLINVEGYNLGLCCYHINYTHQLIFVTNLLTTHIKLNVYTLY